ncbi:MAG: SDR family oxidoreductase [Actinomycetes bacterium]
MARVLVTGGTGTLGRELVPRLLAEGHDVQVLSRSSHPEIDRRAAAVQGDVLSPEQVLRAVTGSDAVVHAATGRRHVRATEVEGTRHVAEAARRCNAHVIYVSIVGVDRHRFPYYRYKYAAEQELVASGAACTVLRATQFHPLIAAFLSRGLFIRTPRLAFQPVDPAEVAARLTQLVSARPAGYAPDFGGPEVLSIRNIVRTRADITGRRARLVPTPGVGFLRDFDAGTQLCPDHREGTVTWAEWLARVTG